MSRPTLTLLYFTLISLWSLTAYAEQPAVLAIRSLNDPVRISTLNDPRACNDLLLKSLYWLSSAQTGGQAPTAVLEDSLAPQARRDMVKEALLRNLVIASRLGLLTPDNLEFMRRGSLRSSEQARTPARLPRSIIFYQLTSSLNSPAHFGIWN